MYRINPEYNHRFNIDFILGDYADLNDAFERGDFILTSEFAEDGTELQGMAFVLAGVIERGIEILGALNNLSGRASVILAFGHWLVDRPAQALEIIDKLLEGASDPQVGVNSGLTEGAGVITVEQAAFRLRELIQGKNHSMAQVVLPPPGKQDPPIEEMKKVKKRHFGQYTLHNLCTQLAPGEINLPDAISRMSEEDRPQAVLSMVNHWIAPEGMDQVSIPRVLWNHDEDNFYHRNYENFRNFDIHLLATSQQHFELSRSTDSFCLSNLILDPYCTPYKPPKRGAVNKDVDILFTGAAFDLFLSDKSRFLFNISKLSKDFNVLIVNGRLPEAQYHDAMARTKFLPVVSRVLGNPSPRWREILENGGFLLYPSKTMFAKMTKGCFGYGIEDPATDIRKHLEAYHQVDNQAYDHDVVLKNVEKDFSPFFCSTEKHQERFLRYVSFATILKDFLNWRQERPAEWQANTKRRLVWLGSSQDIYFWGRTNMIKAILPIIKSETPDESWDDIDYNNLAQTYFRLGQVLGLNPRNDLGGLVSAQERPNIVLIKKALSILEDGLRHYPNSLLLNFNYAQWLLITHIGIGVKLYEGGDAVAIDEAMRRFHEVIANFEKYDFEPLGADIGSPDLAYSDKVFPYFEYGHAILRYGVACGAPQSLSKDDTVCPQDILLAAAHGYLGWACVHMVKYVDGWKHIDRSLELFPNNQNLLRLKVLVLLNVIGKVDLDSKLVGRDLIKTFVAACNEYPYVLLVHLPKVIDVFKEYGEEGELEHLLDDWWWFANALERNTLRSTVSLEHILAIYKHRERLSGDIRKRIDGAHLNRGAAKPLEIWAANVFRLPLFYELLRWPNTLTKIAMRKAVKFWVVRKMARLLLPQSGLTLIWARYLRVDDF